MNVTLPKPRVLPPQSRLQKESSKELRSLVTATSSAKQWLLPTLPAYSENSTLTWCQKVECSNLMRQWFPLSISRGTGVLTRPPSSRGSSKMGRQRIYKCVKQSIIFPPLHLQKMLIWRLSMWRLSRSTCCKKRLRRDVTSGRCWRGKPRHI